MQHATEYVTFITLVSRNSKVTAVSLTTSQLGHVVGNCLGDGRAYGKVILALRRLQEREALPPCVPAARVVEVEVREGKVSEARNREVGAVVEESEDEGRLID
eukprot:scaffold109383_cov51-Phaeocystis_antarctica.AAC.2